MAPSTRISSSRRIFSNNRRKFLFSRHDLAELCFARHPVSEQRAQGRPGFGWHPWFPSAWDEVRRSMCIFRILTIGIFWMAGYFGWQELPQFWRDLPTGSHRMRAGVLVTSTLLNRFARGHGEFRSRRTGHWLHARRDSGTFEVRASFSSLQAEADGAVTSADPGARLRHLSGGRIWGGCRMT
jgi:hypothetical protein